jgi:two-component system, cell cycle response regulator DivK
MQRAGALTHCTRDAEILARGRSSRRAGGNSTGVTLFAQIVRVFEAFPDPARVYTPAVGGAQSVAEMRGHILIVDDNPIDLKLVGELLEIKGFRTERVSDAEQAQRTLTRMLPDLILVDIALPGMDGLTFTRMLKADSRLAHVPVVALTAFAMRGDDQRAHAAGCDAYLTKPVSTRLFSDQILEILDAAGARRRSSVSANVA